MSNSITSLPVLAKCPATFCPLFASKGSPWTKEKNSDCSHEECGWWNKCFGNKEAECHGADTSFECIMEVAEEVGAKFVNEKPSCKFEHECQWQIQLKDKVCPPRVAVMLGLDPRLASG